MSVFNYLILKKPVPLMPQPAWALLRMLGIEIHKYQSWDLLERVSRVFLCP